MARLMMLSVAFRKSWPLTIIFHLCFAEIQCQSITGNRRPIDRCSCWFWRQPSTIATSRTHGLLPPLGIGSDSTAVNNVDGILHALEVRSRIIPFPLSLSYCATLSCWLFAWPLGGWLLQDVSGRRWKLHALSTLTLTLGTIKWCSTLTRESLECMQQKEPNTAVICIHLFIHTHNSHI